MCGSSFLFQSNKKQKKNLKIFVEVTHITCVESFEIFKYSYQSMIVNSDC